MQEFEQFKALNAKIVLGTATPEEHARWAELKQSVLDASEGKRDSPHRQFRRAQLPVDVSFEHENALADAARAFSLGAGGVGLAMAGELQIGDERQLSLKLPSLPEPVLVNARVVWKRLEDQQIGFEFLDLPDAQRDQIDALVWEEVDVSDL